MSFESTDWKTVTVFISSTFSDMHAERDLLVKRVCPELRAWCEDRRLDLVIIDLRWGVTEQDAARNRNALKICFKGIDDARPFFVCFIGQRRGWVPSLKDVSQGTIDAYPEVHKWIGKSSITEMEILHAMRELHVDDSTSSRDSAFFYLREASCLNVLLEKSPGLGQFYTNAAIESERQRQVADDELTAWRDRRIPQLRVPMRWYRANWNARARTPELRIPLSPPANENPAAWLRSWRQAGLKLNDDATSIPPNQLADANRINEELCSGRLTEFACIQCSSGSGDAIRTNEPLEATILNDLKASITARYPHRREIIGDRQSRENDQHEVVARRLASAYVEQPDDFERLDDYLNNPNDRRLLFLHGGAGNGKSTRLAQWSDRVRKLSPGPVGKSVVRFIGAGDLSTSVDSLWRSLFAELNVPPLEEVENVAFIDHLADFAETSILLVLDGLDQLHDGLINLNWLTRYISEPLPPGIKIVTSYRSDAPGAELLTGQIRNSSNGALIEIRGLEDKQYRRRLVETRLGRHLKQLDERDIELLVNYPGSANPLFLSVLLDELQVYGSFVGLREQIAASYGTTPQDAFLGVLKRMEADPAYSAVDPRISVPTVTAFLAAARHGLQRDDLARLLAQASLRSTIERSDQTLVRDADEAVSLLVHQLRAYLATRSGQIDLMYSAFRDAVVRRYFDNSEVFASRPTSQWHADLAAHFTAEWPRGSVLALSEVAYHLALSGQNDELDNTLGDPLYLDLRCQSDQVIDLMNDLGYLRDNAESCRNRDFLKKHAQSLLVHPTALPGTVLREGPQVLRMRLWKAIESGEWPNPVILTEALWHPSPATRSSAFEVLIPVPFRGTVPCACLAAAARRAFTLDGAGKLMQINLDNGRVDSSAFSAADSFVESICSDDGGRVLGLMLDSGQALIRTWNLDDTGRPLRSQILGRVSYKRPAVERPFSTIDSSRFWFQNVEGHVESLCPDSGKIEHWRLPDVAASGELRWLCRDPGGQLWLVIRVRQALIVALTNRTDWQQIEIPKAELLSVCLVNPGMIAVATINNQIRLFSQHPELRIVGETFTKFGMKAICAGDDCLWGVAEHGVINQIKIRNASAFEPEREVRCAHRFPGALSVSSAPSGQLTVLTRTGAWLLQIREEEDIDVLPIQAAYSAGDGGGGYYALRGAQSVLNESENTLEFIDSASGVVRQIASNTFHPHVFAANEHNQVLACRTAGQGFLLDLTYHGTHLIEDLMDGVDSACSGPNRVFYLIDENGLMMRFDVQTGHSQWLGRLPLPGVTAPKVYRVGDEIVAVGRCANDRRDLVDFVALLDARQLKQGRAGLAGVRTLQFPEGRIRAVAVSADGRNLCLLSDSGVSGCQVRLGTIGDFLSKREIHHDSVELLSPVAAQFSSDGQVLFVIHRGGVLSAMDVYSGTQLAVLAGTRPFTALVATDDSPQSVFAVEAGYRLHQCQLWRPKGLL